MTPAELTADSIASWYYAVAALRAQWLAEQDGRTLTPAELVRAADRLLGRTGA